MNQVVKVRWADALRSGKYKQGRGALHRPATATKSGEAELCCLGVLCELAVAEGIVVRELRGDCYVYLSAEDVSDWASGDLPTAVAEWAGLPARDPKVLAPRRTVATYLSALNDDQDSRGRSFTFGELANSIDRSL